MVRFLIVLFGFFCMSFNASAQIDNRKRFGCDALKLAEESLAQSDKNYADKYPRNKFIFTNKSVGHTYEVVYMPTDGKSGVTLAFAINVRTCTIIDKYQYQ